MSGTSMDGKEPGEVSSDHQQAPITPDNRPDQNNPPDKQSQILSKLRSNAPPQVEGQSSTRIVSDGLSIRADPVKAEIKPNCTVQALQSGLGGYLIGIVFGSVSAIVTNLLAKKPLSEKLMLLRKSAGQSGKMIGTVSALQVFGQCAAARIRNKEDDINTGIGGCLAGVGLSYQGGPVAMLQSCVTLGAITFLFTKYLGKDQAAIAATQNSAKADRGHRQNQSQVVAVGRHPQSSYFGVPQTPLVVAQLQGLLLSLLEPQCQRCAGSGLLWRASVPLSASGRS